jgi:hypothetical protein
VLERYARVLKVLTFGLLGLIALQAAFLGRGSDPLRELEAGPADFLAVEAAGPAVAAEKVAPAPGPGSAAEQGPAEKGAAAPDPGPARPEGDLPEKYRRIATSGIFGVEPTKQVPLTLFGLAGSYAIIMAPTGQTDLVPEGGELGGVKVLKISTNRALVEYQGKKQELTIFSGLGSESLLPSGKEKSP